MDFTYDNAPYPIPRLTYITITHDVIRGNEDHFQYLERITGIPHNGNRDAPLWNDEDTAITYALRLTWTQYTMEGYERIARLVSVLYRKCGIPVFGEMSGIECPLSLCITFGNLPAARALLRDTDARFVNPLEWQNKLDSMITNRQAKLLQLFSMYKARTFPEAGQYLNSFQGRDSTHIPLFKAVLRNDPRLVHVLIYGFDADPYIQDNRGRMAIDLIRDTVPINERFGEDPSEPRDIEAVINEEIVKRDEIIRLLQPRERLLASVMSQHPHLGSLSMMGGLSPDIIYGIHRLSLQDP